jgi:hypothetical protein
MKTKGFDVVVLKTCPSVGVLRNELVDACQLWIISSHEVHLKAPHIQCIKNFFEQGHGL